MKLQFPTEAEKVLTAFTESTKTVSIAKLARDAGAVREVADFGRLTIYVFPDDTTLEVRGRGRAHKAVALLP